MYIVKWDDREGNRHKHSFERLEDAVLEADSLRRSERCEYVSIQSN